MFKEGLEGEKYFRTFFHCFLLSFLSGNVNAGGFLACGRYVTHVTGFATLYGIDMAQGDFKAALGIMSVPVYFLLGSMVSGFLIDRRIHLGRQAGYPIVMGLIALCLLTAALGGYLHFFGLFGESSNLKQDYLLLVLLCGASGLQNAAITTFSGSVVRTTHLTGITTDLGVGLVRAYASRLDLKKRSLEVRANWLRILTIGGFILGSWVGAYLFLKLRYLAFFLPTAIACYAMAVTWRTQKNTPFVPEVR